MYVLTSKRFHLGRAPHKHDYHVLALYPGPRRIRSVHAACELGRRAARAGQGSTVVHACSGFSVTLLGTTFND